MWFNRRREDGAITARRVVVNETGRSCSQCFCGVDVFFCIEVAGIVWYFFGFGKNLMWIMFFVIVRVYMFISRQGFPDNIWSWDTFLIACSYCSVIRGTQLTNSKISKLYFPSGLESAVQSFTESTACRLTLIKIKIFKKTILQILFLH